MLKEAIEKIAAMATESTAPIMVDGHTYLIDKEDHTRFVEIKPELDMPEVITLNSLDAVVQMVRHEASVHYEGPVYIEVSTHISVDVFLEANAVKRYDRATLYRARATDVPGWENTVKLPFDQAGVALQTRFQDGGDREYALNLLSQITCGAKVTYNDTGVATTIVTSKGVSLQQNQTIRPLVKLRPYRTFQEVVQPEGLFLIRIDERGITFTEADGGMWKLTARKTVAEYLRTALADLVDADRVVVML